MRISQFNSFPKKGQPHIADSTLTISDFIGHIKYGTWKEQVEKIRVETEKEKRDFLKRSLPSFTIAGTFTERDQYKLIQHSGFLCIDIDYFSDKKELINDQYTYALFKSASGGGLAVIVKVNPDKHKESYSFLRNYYFSTFGIPLKNLDSAPSSVASLRFASYDPEIFINEKSKVSRYVTRKPKKIPSLPIVLPGDTVGEMVSECVNLGLDIAPDYDSYYKLAFAIADGFGEDGRDWFYSLCSVSEKYDSRHAEKQYDIALKGNKQGITIGTFYWMLKQVGIHVPDKSKEFVQLAAMGKKSGRSKDAISKQLVEMKGIEPNMASNLVNEVFKRNDIELKGSTDTPEELIKALFEWMEQNHPLKRNEITKKIEEDPGSKEVEKERINSIYLRARMFFNNKEVTKHLVESYIFSDFIPEYNPITDYFNKNKHRKSKGNIDTLIKSIRSDTEMKAIFIRKWVISIIASYDGNAVRSVLALTGGQNTGKTQWFRRLLPDGLKKYYAESKLDAGKDDDLLMCQKLIIMDDEMGGKSRNDEKRFKELTSKSIFSLRAPYGAGNMDYKRLALLCGTSNPDNIINDPTGNTRILPIKVDSIDHELYNSINKDELIMEAYNAYYSGEEWELNKEELKRLDELSSDFEGTPFERELILSFFGKPEPGQYTEFLTATEIKDIIESNTKQKIMNMNRFGTELKRVLGDFKSKKINGIAMKRYEVVRYGTTKNTMQGIENEQDPF